jgi:hypothetical protein
MGEGSTVGFSATGVTVAGLTSVREGVHADTIKTKGIKLRAKTALGDMRRSLIAWPIIDLLYANENLSDICSMIHSSMNFILSLFF